MVQNRTHDAQAAEPQRHSPLYRREKIAENVKREDVRELTSVYSLDLIHDKFDHDLEKFYGVSA